MKRDELIRFAAAGVAKRVADIERELATYWKDYPDLFLGKTQPQLLRAEMKNGHTNGHGEWPPIAVVKPPRKKYRRRTSSPSSHPSSRPGTKAAAPQRKQTAQTLAKVERGDALTTADKKRIPVLFRYGYLKMQGDEMIRTGKPFHV